MILWDFMGSHGDVLGFYRTLWWFNRILWDLMVVQWDFMGFHGQLNGILEALKNKGHSDIQWDFMGLMI